jgi:16S rRNA (cytosine967-C5)-methyltransferase
MPEISPARAAALTALSLWRTGGRGSRAEEILSDLFIRQRIDARDRALAHELFYGTIRNLIRLDYILSQFIKRKSSDVDADVRDVLRIAAYQLIFLDRVPAHAAVNDAVEQAKLSHGRGAASFVNGVLRAMQRGAHDIVMPDPSKDPAACLSVTHSFPLWLVRRWLSRYGPDEAGLLMAASNSVPPLTLRVNTLRTTRDKLASTMADAGVETENARYSPDGLIVRSGASIKELPGYSEGLFAVQDEAAQLVSILLGPDPGDTVLDACAAPGGKALHIYALSGGSARVLALDIGLDKSMLMKENIARLGADGVYVAVADAAAGLPADAVFDRVLIDAPCSALGIVRRRPEVRYVRRKKDIARLSALQSDILDIAAGCLKRNGTMVYSTCTTEPEEGELVIERFLAGHQGFVSDNAATYLPAEAAAMVTADGYMRSYPHLHGTDGFFAARIRRLGQ